MKVVVCSAAIKAENNSPAPHVELTEWQKIGIGPEKDQYLGMNLGEGRDRGEMIDR